MLNVSQSRVGKFPKHVVLITVVFLVAPVWTLHYDLGMLRIPEDTSDTMDAATAKVAAARVSALSEFPFTLGIVDVLFPSEPWEYIRKTCSAMEQHELVGFVGPAWSSRSKFITKVGAAHSLPIISQSASASFLSDTSSYPTFYRVIPSDADQVVALKQLLIQYKWNRLALIYADDAYGQDGLVQLSSNLGEVASIEAFHPVHYAAPNCSAAFADIVAKDIFVIIFWLGDSAIESSMLQAYDAGLTVGTHALIGSWGFSWGKTDIVTGSKLSGMISTESRYAGNYEQQDLLRTWRQYSASTAPASVDLIPRSAYFAYDSVMLMAHALKNAFNNSGTAIVPRPRGNCKAAPWAEGPRMMRLLDGAKFTGLTGSFSLENHEQPADWTITNLEISPQGAVWTDRFSYKRSVPNELALLSPMKWLSNANEAPKSMSRLNGKHLRILFADSPPFINVAPGVTGNARLSSGFLVDLLDELTADLGFTYTATVHTELSPRPSYNGMVELVSQGKYDLLMADLTITASRQQLVKFSHPYFTLGIGMMAAKPTYHEPFLFEFLAVFDGWLWLMLWLTIAAVSVCMYFLEVDRNEEVRRGKPGMAKATVYGLWALVEDPAWAAITPSGMTLALFVMFVFMIVNASYTATLATALSKTYVVREIDSFDDIASGSVALSDVCVQADSSLSDFMTATTGPGFSTAPSSDACLDNIEAGKGKVFLSDYPTLEARQRTRDGCKVEIVGEEFNKFGFGLAATENFLWMHELDGVILRLSAEGKFGAMWQKALQRGTKCASGVTGGGFTPLKVDSLLGLFILWGIGALIAVGVHFYQVKYRSEARARQRAKIEQGSDSGSTGSDASIHGPPAKNPDSKPRKHKDKGSGSEEAQRLLAATSLNGTLTMDQTPRNAATLSDVSIDEQVVKTVETDVEDTVPVKDELDDYFGSLDMPHLAPVFRKAHVGVKDIGDMDDESLVGLGVTDVMERAAILGHKPGQNTGAGVGGSGGDGVTPGPVTMSMGPTTETDVAVALEPVAADPALTEPEPTIEQEPTPEPAHTPAVPASAPKPKPEVVARIRRGSVAERLAMFNKPNTLHEVVDDKTPPPKRVVSKRWQPKQATEPESEDKAKSDIVPTPGAETATVAKEGENDTDDAKGQTVANKQPTNEADVTSQESKQGDDVADKQSDDIVDKQSDDIVDKQSDDIVDKRGEEKADDDAAPSQAEEASDKRVTETEVAPAPAPVPASAPASESPTQPKPMSVKEQIAAREAERKAKAAAASSDVTSDDKEPKSQPMSPEEARRAAFAKRRQQNRNRDKEAAAKEEATTADVVPKADGPDPVVEGVGVAKDKLAADVEGAKDEEPAENAAAAEAVGVAEELGPKDKPAADVDGAKDEEPAENAAAAEAVGVAEELGRNRSDSHGSASDPQPSAPPRVALDDDDDAFDFLD